jgi:hypothetical protein
MKMKLNFSLVESLVVERNSGHATNCNGRKKMKMKMMMMMDSMIDNHPRIYLDARD